MTNDAVTQRCLQAIVLSLSLVVAGAAGTVRAGSPTLRTVALSGDSAPGTAASFADLAYVVVNTHGQAVLHAHLTGNSDGPCDEFGDPPPDQGVWSEATGVLALVAARGDHAPGTDPMVTFNAFDAPLLNDDGQSAFLAFLTGMEADGDCANADNNVGVWSGGSGDLGLVAIAGSPAPGTPEGVTFNNVAMVRVNGAGQAAVSAFLNGVGVDPSNSRGIWSEGLGSLALLARGGSQAPGTDRGVNFDWFGSGSPVINVLGQTAFRGALVGPGVDDTNSYGLWADTSGAVVLVVRAGSPAPGAGDDVVFSWLGSPHLNDTGNIAFLSSLAGAGVSASNDLGMWSDTSGALTLIARTGSSAPGTAGTFSDLGDPAFNGTGRIAFRGFTAPGVSGIWSEGPGALALVARVGDSAPGTRAGINFAGFGHPAFNDAGHTAFWAVLSGPGVNGSNDTGLWAESPSGELTLIVREGDPLEVAPGDIRTMTWLSLVTGSAQGGRSTGFNDAGQIAFGSSFTDGSSGGFVGSFCSIADLTGDCRVGIEDLLQLLAAWGPCPPAAACPGDLDADGTVGILDFLMLLAEWMA